MWDRIIGKTVQVLMIGPCLVLSVDRAMRTVRVQRQDGIGEDNEYEVPLDYIIRGAIPMYHVISSNKTKQCPNCKRQTLLTHDQPYMDQFNVPRVQVTWRCSFCNHIESDILEDLDEYDHVLVPQEVIIQYVGPRGIDTGNPYWRSYTLEELDTLMEAINEARTQKETKRMNGSKNRRGLPYPYIRAWGHYMGSMSHYIQDQLRQAAEENAPQNAIYKQGDGKWLTVDGIEDIALQDYLEKWLDE
jgi:hypothetical protein